MSTFVCRAALAATLSLICLAPIAFASGIHGSIRLAPERGHETAQSEAQESLKLTPLAKISKARAVAIAKKASSGKVKVAELDNEGGYLVWSVTVGKHEVLVDAGNGKVLGVGKADD